MEFSFKYPVTIDLLPFTNVMIMPMDTPGLCCLLKIYIYIYICYVKLLEWVCG